MVVWWGRYRNRDCFGESGPRGKAENEFGYRWGWLGFRWSACKEVERMVCGEWVQRAGEKIGKRDLKEQCNKKTKKRKNFGYANLALWLIWFRGV